MRDRFVSELESYQQAVEAAVSFTYVVSTKSGDTITSSPLPVAALPNALADLEAFEQGLSLPIWDRVHNQLFVIPAREIAWVKLVLKKNDD